MTSAIFAKSKKHRDKKCVNKDVIVRSIIRALKILDPRNFFAMLMPNLFGIEIFFLHNRGVPSSNIYAVERDPDIRRYLKPSQIARVFNVERYLKYVDEIFKRVFGR